MCTFNLTVIPRHCAHELPTVTYCSAAQPAVDAYNRLQAIGQDAIPPPEMCNTNSMGWTLYTHLKVPVKCATCIEWLTTEGKRTYGGVAVVKGKHGKASKAEGEQKMITVGGESDAGESGSGEEADAKESKPAVDQLFNSGRPMRFIPSHHFPIRFHRGMRF